MVPTIDMWYISLTKSKYNIIPLFSLAIYFRNAAYLDRLAFARIPLEHVLDKSQHDGTPGRLELLESGLHISGDAIS